MGFDELTPKQIAKGTRLAKQMLRGVGAGDCVRFRSDPAEYAIHCQKPLTELECSRLPSGWMAIKAVHEVGPRVLF